MLQLRNVVLMVVVFSCPAWAQDGGRYGNGGTVGGAKVEPSKGPVISVKPPRNTKPRKRMSPGQSVDLSVCDRNREACVCPSGYLKLEGVEGQSIAAAGNDKLVRVDQLKQFKRVIQCVKPCSDGTVPIQEMGIDGKLKSRCAT